MVADTLLIAILMVVCAAGSGRGQQPAGETPATGDVHPVADELLAPLAADRARCQGLLRQTGEEAALAESEHFVVAYTAPEQAARGLLARLEHLYQAHARFVSALRVPARRPRHKLEVLLFATHEQFRDYLRGGRREADGALGCFLPDVNICVLFDLDQCPEVAAIRQAVEQAAPERPERLLRRLDQRSQALVLSVIQHEVAHQIQLNMGILPSFERVPGWLVEGLAMLFEVRFDSASDASAMINSYRLYEFRRLYADRAPAGPEVARMLADDQAWCGARCYPLAWAVVRYLRAEWPREFAAFLRQMTTQDGWPRDLAARQALLEKRFGAINDAWVERLYLVTMKLEVAGGPFAE